MRHEVRTLHLCDRKLHCVVLHSSPRAVASQGSSGQTGPLRGHNRVLGGGQTGRLEALWVFLLFCLHDYILLIIHVDITHSCFGHDLTHVMLSCSSKMSNTTLVTIVIQSKIIINLISCKHSFLKKKVLLVEGNSEDICSKKLSNQLQMLEGFTLTQIIKHRCKARLKFLYIQT
jgi:hypothetical protein